MILISLHLLCSHVRPYGLFCGTPSCYPAEIQIEITKLTSTINVRREFKIIIQFPRVLKFESVLFSVFRLLMKYQILTFENKRNDAITYKEIQNIDLRGLKS